MGLSQDTSRHRKCIRDLTYVFASRRTINRYIEDASYMNILIVAKRFINKGDDVVTVGLDDTVKAAGHKRYDLKTDHITFQVLACLGKQ